MKNFVRIFAILIALGLFVGLSGFTASINNGAGVLHEGTCGLFDGYGNSISSTKYHKVTNHSGNIILTCQAKDVATPGTVYQNAGFPCGVSGNITTDSQATVSAGGNATLRCAVKP